MEEFDFYPPKPELIEYKPKTSLSLTVFSIVLFILVFLMFFRDEFSLILYLVLVLLIHESGHFLTMKLFKYKDVRMLFVPLMGAFVHGRKSEYSERESFWVIIAGPMPGVLIGAVLMWYANVIHSDWLVELSGMFLILNIANLLPLDPLDGGQLFKLYAKKNQDLFLMISAFLASIAMIGTGFLMPGSWGAALIVFGFVMGFRVRSLQKQHLMHKELRDEEVDYFTTYKLLSNKDFLKIKEVVLDNTPALRKYINDAHVSEEQTGQILASQVNNVLVKPLKNDASVFFKIVVLLLWLISFAVPFLLYFTLDIAWIRSIYVVG